MTIDQLNKEMANQINRLPEGEMGEVILDDSLFHEIPEVDAFLEPPEDVMIDAPEALGDNRVIYIRETMLLLGMYIPMRSPGQVVLFGKNLDRFYWSLVRATHHSVPYMTKLDLHGAWSLVLMKTYQHELFHYNINVLQEMFGGSYTPTIEEALAVAWARMKIQGERAKRNSQIGRMNDQFYSLLMRKAFDYRSSGYRDWGMYADEVRFKPALLAYIAPDNHARLQANGVDMERLIYGMIGQMEKGYVERVW